MELGRIGIWTAVFHGIPAARVRERSVEVEELGFGSVWIPDALGRDPFVAAMLLTQDTSTLTTATGVVNIHGRHPMTMRAGWESVHEASEGRFVLGLGVSHAPMVEGFMGHEYAKPLATMRTYLESMDEAVYAGASGSTAKARVLAALGPKMLALAAQRSNGALTYFVPVEHTPIARTSLDDALDAALKDAGGDASGERPTLAVEQAVVLSSDPDEARRIARAHTALYCGLPNYTNNLRRLGFDDDDFAHGGSDHLVDAIVAWGDEEAITARVRAHLDAGADHVCIQVLTDPQFRDSIDEWRILAPALIGL